MKRCPITYESIPETSKYSSSGLKLLARNLSDLRDLPFSAEEQRQEAVRRASKMSIQGLQPKLSARINVAKEVFEIVDIRGEFILKPTTEYPEVPANEGVTMRMAKHAGIEVPLHGLIYSKDGSFTYFVKRFDRTRTGKLQVEDFSQLLGMTRDTKYNSRMERIVSVIDKYCSFPVVEKLKLFRLTLFNYLVGNEDAHLKNFSLITRDNKIELSPAYDLVNTTIVLGNATEEIALPLEGRQRNLSLSNFVEYFGRGQLELPEAAVLDVLSELTKKSGQWEDYVQESFLTDGMKKSYVDLLRNRRTILGLM